VRRARLLPGSTREVWGAHPSTFGSYSNILDHGSKFSPQRTNTQQFHLTSAKLRIHQIRVLVKLGHIDVFNTTIHVFQIRTDIRYTFSQSEADCGFVALSLPKLL
jgi:hypothetical protein